MRSGNDFKLEFHYAKWVALTDRAYPQADILLFYLEAWGWLHVRSKVGYGAGWLHFGFLPGDFLEVVIPRRCISASSRRSSNSFEDRTALASNVS